MILPFLRRWRRAPEVAAPPSPAPASFAVPPVYGPSVRELLSTTINRRMREPGSAVTFARLNPSPTGDLIFVGELRVQFQVAHAPLSRNDNLMTALQHFVLVIEEEMKAASLRALDREPQTRETP